MRRFGYWIAVLVCFAGCSRKQSSDPGQKPESKANPAQTTGETESTKSNKTGTPDGTGPAAGSRAPNVLLFIADDLGVDVLKASALTKNPALTPNIDKLAASGVVFENFWVTPACTTTRGALISGQHGFRSGVTHVPAVMPDATPTIQQRLKAADIQPAYATGIFGKWHLGGPNADPAHPARFGVDLYAGNLFNLDDYSRWTLTQNGQQSESTTYHTTKVVDLAKDFIAGQPSETPWFAWVAFVAPHSPFHTPPASLITETPADNVPSQYRAMVQAMDTEIGRLVGSLSPEVLAQTLIIFLGDNGTPRAARDRDIFAQDHVKNTIYEGGIRAPLIISGAGVTRKGEREAAMVNATDVFATLVDLASTAPVPADLPPHSISFASLLGKAGPALRSFNYTEWVADGQVYVAVRDQEHKMILFPDAKTELYKTSDISETTPIDDSATLQRLRTLADQVRNNEAYPEGGVKRAAFCADHAGTKTHQGLDVGRNQSLAGSITVRVNGDSCEINTNGIPNHNFNDGQRVFPHPVSEQDFALRVPLEPKANATVTALALDTDNGILLNGAKVDMLAAACFGVGSGKIGCNDMSQPWRYDPVFLDNGFSVDGAFAHTQPDGAYHYHGVGAPIGENQIIGVAADGFPIHSASIEMQGIKRTMRSSYRLRQGNRVQTDPSKPFPGGSYDGTYRDDWEYVKGLGDLDECNGATIAGQYMYFATESFPYFLGCFRGTPDPSFKKRGPRSRTEHAHGPGWHQH